MVEQERYVAATEKCPATTLLWTFARAAGELAVAVAERLTKQNPRSSEDFRALGDAFRALGPRTPAPVSEELSASKGEKRCSQDGPTNSRIEEYDNALVATPAGKAAMEASQKQSEEAYRKALELDPANAAAHRGRGFLYEKQHLPAQCAEDFRKYLELAPNALDQLQIHRRLETAEKEGALAGCHPACDDRERCALSEALSAAVD